MDLGDDLTTPVKARRQSDAEPRSTEKQAKLPVPPPPTPSASSSGSRSRRTPSSYTTNPERYFMQLDPRDPDVRHVHSCPLSDCARCVWAFYKSSWLEKLPEDPEHPERGSWLYSEEKNKRWSLKCRVCVAAKAKSALATGFIPSKPRLALFYNHAKTKSHCKSLAIARGAPATSWELEGAPPQGDFLKLLDAIRSGKAHGSKGVQEVGRQKKCRKMKYCLAEARRVHIRAFFRTAQCVAMHQDKRGSMLAIRFKACDKKLNTLKGVLGSADVTKCVGEGSATGIRNATLELMRNICTPGFGIPYRKIASEPDGAALLGLFNSTELFDADAASDETLAGKMLRGTLTATENNADPGGNDDLGTVLPNLKICNRDKPHGSRRTRTASK